jgi:hypothetical protein
VRKVQALPIANGDGPSELIQLACSLRLAEPQLRWREGPGNQSQLVFYAKLFHLVEQSFLIDLQECSRLLAIPVG